MSQISNNRSARAQKIPHTLWLSAAQRLVSAPGQREAAKRLISSATDHGIDLNLMWGTLEHPIDESPDTKPDSTNRVRQVVLTVLGSGRTAMLFLSNLGSTKAFGTNETQINEISQSIEVAIRELGQLSTPSVTLAQTLIEPKHSWAYQACLSAGMISVGRLDYMRKRLTDKDLTPRPNPSWPDGISVRPIRSLDPQDPSSDYQHLIAALEGSYHDTLDCPELCGLRSMTDVVESHKATGDFDPSRWCLIFKDDQPAGCCLLSHFPQSHSVELVYLGISPQARGLGLGTSVLSHAINQLGPIGATEITCAVDNRNHPAIKIYEALGFSCFDARIGFVAPIKA